MKESMESSAAALLKRLWQKCFRIPEKGAECKFLHDPGPILAQLAEQLQSRQAQTQDLEQERLATALALSHKDA